MDVLLLLSVIVIVLLLVVIAKNLKTRSDIPGPWGLPILGHLPFINLKQPHHTFTEWQKSYGRLMKVNMGGQELVIVNGYEAIKEMFNKQEFNYRPDFFRINTYRQMGGFGFSEPNGCWKSLRKAVHQGIRSYGSGMCRMNRILSHINDTTMSKISEATVSGPFDPWSIVYGHMLRSITAFTLGEHIEPTEQLYNVVERLDALALVVLNPGGAGATLDTAPWLRHLGHPTWKGLKELLDVRDELWAIVEPGLKGVDAASIAHSFLQTQAENPEIDDERVKCAIGDMMIAGTVTTSVSTYCLLQILCHHPEVQLKIQKEIDQVLGSSATACVEDMNEMPYTRATMLEVQRYVCVTPLGLPHCSGQEATLAGQTVPKGTNLLPNLWSLHKDEEFWSQPHEFLPERFLCDKGELLPADHPNRRRLLAFGMGPRLCPGEMFSYNRIFMLITSLLKTYNVQIAPESAQIPYQPHTFSVTMAAEPHRYRLMTSLRQKPAKRAVYRKAGEA